MQHLDVTRMSAKGQVVIPGDIREALALSSGTKFVVVGEGDTVILKRIGRPTLAEVDKLFAEGRSYAKQARLKKVDIKRAIHRSRSR